MIREIRHAALALLVSLGTLTAASAADAPVATDAWARATPPGSDVAAVYLTLHGGTVADRLLGASTARAAKVHLHAVEDAGGMAKMRPVDAVAVPAGQVVALAPKGHHLMLMGLDRPLVAGEHFALTLHFEKGGDRTVDVQVRPATAPEPAAPEHR